MVTYEMYVEFKERISLVKLLSTFKKLKWIVDLNDKYFEMVIYKNKKERYDSENITEPIFDKIINQKSNEDISITLTGSNQARIYLYILKKHTEINIGFSNDNAIYNEDVIKVLLKLTSTFKKEFSIKSIKEFSDLEEYKYILSKDNDFVNKVKEKMK